MALLLYLIFLVSIFHTLHAQVPKPILQFGETSDAIAKINRGYMLHDSILKLYRLSLWNYQKKLHEWCLEVQEDCTGEKMFSNDLIFKLENPSWSFRANRVVLAGLTPSYAENLLLDWLSSEDCKSSFEESFNVDYRFTLEIVTGLQLPKRHHTDPSSYEHLVPFSEEINALIGKSFKKFSSSGWIIRPFQKQLETIRWRYFENIRGVYYAYLQQSYSIPIEILDDVKVGRQISYRQMNLLAISVYSKIQNILSIDHISPQESDLYLLTKEKINNEIFSVLNSVKRPTSEATNLSTEKHILLPGAVFLNQIVLYALSVDFSARKLIEFIPAREMAQPILLSLVHDDSALNSFDLSLNSYFLDLLHQILTRLKDLGHFELFCKQIYFSVGQFTCYFENW